MFGIVFVGHTDLRRILTDYGYMWHPLRKDFPLSGYIEIHYDEQYKCIMHNDINLIQEYRHWVFEHAWPFNEVDNLPHNDN